MTYSPEFGGMGAFSDKLYLESGQRGKGLGQQALRFAEAHCRTNNILALHQEVERNNSGAQAAYRKAGSENRSHYFLMSKRL